MAIARSVGAHMDQHSRQRSRRYWIVSNGFPSVEVVSIENNNIKIIMDKDKRDRGYELSQQMRYSCVQFIIAYPNFAILKFGFLFFLFFLFLTVPFFLSHSAHLPSTIPTPTQYRLFRNHPRSPRIHSTMSLPPKYSGHRIAGNSQAEHTLELYLDYVCPFSAKIWKQVYHHVVPWLEQEHPGKVQVGTNPPYSPPSRQP